jgi:hypothetical protein
MNALGITVDLLHPDKNECNFFIDKNGVYFMEVTLDKQIRLQKELWCANEYLIKKRCPDKITKQRLISFV